MKYVIILAEDVSSIDFNQVLETSEDTLRYSLNRHEALVKFEGSTPTFLIGKAQHDYEGNNTKHRFINTNSTNSARSTW